MSLGNFSFRISKLSGTTIFMSWCKPCVAINRIKWKKENPEKVLQYDRYYRTTEKRIEYAKKYKQSKKYKAQCVRYRADNRDKINKYFTERAKIDPNFKMRLRLRTRIYLAFKERKFRKSSNTIDLIGCDFNKLQRHIEKQFTSKMNWENYGKWHIDHIIPLHKFDLTKLKNQKMAFNYRNLQPLMAHENLSKNGKYQK